MLPGYIEYDSSLTNVNKLKLWFKDEIPGQLLSAREESIKTEGLYEFWILSVDFSTKGTEGSEWLDFLKSNGIILSYYLKD